MVVKRKHWASSAASAARNSGTRGIYVNPTGSKSRNLGKDGINSLRQQQGDGTADQAGLQASLVEG